MYFVFAIKKKILKRNKKKKKKAEMKSRVNKEQDHD